MPPARSYLDRYLAGEHEQVWADLLALGPAVRDESVYLAALAVARETMRRVRHNIELLIPRLRDIGYHFYRYGIDIYTSWSLDQAAEVHRLEPVYGPPSAEVRDTIEVIEQKVGGPLPLSLRAFYEVVGTVNLTGRRPDWQIRPYYLDALEVHSAEVALEGCDEWGPEEYMGVPIAPDEYFKDGCGGSGPYIVQLPDPAADAPLMWERHDTTLVNYLRICFRWGGFPSLERAPNPRWPTSPTSPPTSSPSERRPPPCYPPLTTCIPAKSAIPPARMNAGRSRPLVSCAGRLRPRPSTPPSAAAASHTSDSGHFGHVLHLRPTSVHQIPAKSAIPLTRLPVIFRPFRPRHPSSLQPRIRIPAVSAIPLNCQRSRISRFRPFRPLLPRPLTFPILIFRQNRQFRLPANLSGTSVPNRSAPAVYCRDRTHHIRIAATSAIPPACSLSHQLRLLLAHPSPWSP